MMSQSDRLASGRRSPIAFAAMSLQDRDPRSAGS
jgi:hypothetical protein